MFFTASVLFRIQPESLVPFHTAFLLAEVFQPGAFLNTLSIMAVCVRQKVINR